ncbi:hypothetical protein [Streptomyces phaeolivaceus]|uniref:hypothetical protein n=1 Tax=Streptomyces phaeolivaceus TaxID=2653200 RepID=UPI00186ABABB|nr:hypothetical protein [Streptomyces phaeolivaceus]
MPQQDFSTVPVSGIFPEFGQLSQGVGVASVGSPPQQGFGALLVSREYPELSKLT